MAFQFRRGTDAERQSITPKAGEPLFVTDTGKVYVGNGTTQGGLLVSASLSDDDSPSLGGNLDLNNNSIVGTGNINIDGTITATGSINLGDGSEDNIIVGGVIGSSLIPDTDGLYDLGSSDFYWRKGYFEDVAVDGELTANSLQIKTIELDDSTTIFDADLNSIFVENIEGNLTGSVYSTDSTLIIDKDTSDVIANSLTITGNEILGGGFITFNSTIEVYDPDSIAIQQRGETFGDDNTRCGIQFESFKGDIDTPETIEDNSLLVGIISRGFHTDSYVDAGLITITADGTIPTSKSVPGKINFFTNDGSTDSVNTGREMSYNAKGVFTAPIIKATSYDDTSFPDNPESGWIIFDSTNSQFVGYNGTDWIPIS